MSDLGMCMPQITQGSWNCALHMQVTSPAQWLGRLITRQLQSLPLSPPSTSGSVGVRGLGYLSAGCASVVVSVCLSQLSAGNSQMSLGKVCMDPLQSDGGTSLQ
jgi:hypothetical protein